VRREIYSKPTDYSLVGPFLVSLAPWVFHKMLRLPESILTFKGEDFREFLKKHDNGVDLLLEFL
jgi:hypothetical protein